MGSLIVNGRDARDDFGFKMGRELRGWRDGLEYERPTGRTPDGIGDLVLSDEASARERAITVPGWMVAADVSTLRSNWRAFRDLLSSGLLEVSFSDAPDRFFYAEARYARVTPIGPAMTSDSHSVEIQFVAEDPVLYEKQGSVVSLSSSPTPVPTGSGPSVALVEISGPVTDPSVVYRDHRGAEVARLDLAVSLSSSESRVVDLTAMTVRDGAGNGTISEVNGGRFFSVSGQEAASESGPNPKLEVTPDPGAATYRGKRGWV